MRNRNRDHVLALQRRHVTKLAGAHHIHGLDAQPGRQQPVIGRRYAAALRVAQHRHPRFNACQFLDLLRQQVPDAPSRVC